MTWSKTERIAFGLFVVGALASLSLLVHPWYDATNDGSMYIACARSIVAGEGYRYLGEAFRIRPPGLSYLIAPIIALRGTDFLALNSWIALFGVAGVALTHLFQRARLGWPLALAVAVALWLNPGWQRSCNQVMSEMPGVALLLGALLVERRAARSRSIVWEIVLGLTIAAATYMRTVNVLLVPAILAARTLAHLWPSARNPVPEQLGHGAFLLRRLVPFAAVAVLALIPWSVRNARDAAPPPADQTMLYSYSAGMWHADGGDPASRRLTVGEVLERVPRQAQRSAQVLGSRMKAVLPFRTRQLARGDEWQRVRYQGPLVVAAAVLLLVGAAVGLVRRREAADVFTWLALGVIAIYFGFDDRLLMPVYVLAFPATALLLRDVLRRFVGARADAVAVIVVGVVAAMDFAPRDDWARIQRQHEAFEEIAASAAAELDDDARLAASVGWHYSVYLDRPVVSLDWGCLRAARQGRPVEDAAQATIDRYDVDAVLLSPLVEADRSYIPHFRENNLGYVERGPARVIRVRP